MLLMLSFPFELFIEILSPIIVTLGITINKTANSLSVNKQVLYIVCRYYQCHVAFLCCICLTLKTPLGKDQYV
jgi:uncharacterized membrane protein